MSTSSNFIEVYAEAGMDTLVRRDVKGLYRKALAGEIAHFTGVSDPYEPPTAAEVVVRSDRESVEVSLDRLLAALAARGLIRAGSAAPTRAQGAEAVAAS